MKIFTALLFASLLLNPSVAFADTDATTQKGKEEFVNQVMGTAMLRSYFEIMKMQSACGEEISNLCPIENFAPCLKENRRKVKADCKNAINEVFGGEPLTQSEVYKGVLIPEGSRYVYGNGYILGVRLSKPIEYKGVHFNEGFLRFHNGESEGVREGFLAFDQVINGVKYKAGSSKKMNSQTSFDVQGSVIEAILAEDTLINGLTFAAGYEISFSDGRVRSGYLKNESEIYGVTFNGKQGIFFAQNGDLKVYLNEGMTLNNMTFMEKSELIIHPNGKVKAGVLKNAQTVEGKAYKAKTEVTFNEEGVLIRADEPEDELKVGDVIEVPAISVAYLEIQKEKGFSEKKYKGKKVLKIKTIYSILPTSKFTRDSHNFDKDFVVEGIFPAQTKLVIVHLNSEENEAIVKDGKGNLYALHLYMNHILFAGNEKCFTSLCKDFEKILEAKINEKPSKKFKIIVNFARLTPRELARLTVEKAEKGEEGPELGLQAWKTHCRKNGIKTETHPSLIATANVNLKQLAHILLNYEKLRLSSVVIPE